MYRLVALYTAPEYAQVYLSGGTQYQLDPAVEVFVFGLMLAQLLDCWLWPVGCPISETTYLQTLASGQYQLPVSLRPSALLSFLMLKLADS